MEKPENIICVENTSAVFRCKLNTRNVPVEWLYEGGNKEVVKLYNSKKYVIKQDGVEHSLEIKKVTKQDEGHIHVALPNHTRQIKRSLEVTGMI